MAMNAWWSRATSTDYPVSILGASVLDREVIVDELPDSLYSVLRGNAQSGPSEARMMAQRTAMRDLPRSMDRSILTATLTFSFLSLAMLAYVAARSPDRQRALAILVYGATFATCALCSFLYHTLSQVRWRPFLRYCDHAAIFLLIAGTYTPFAAANDLRGPFGFSVLQWVWALTSIGMALKIVLLDGYDRSFVGLYIGIGWFILVAGKAAIAAIAPPSLALLALGGLVYTAGAIVYLRDGGRWTAPIWHCCVFIGGVAHFLAVVVMASLPVA
jgi:hemolysin III